MRGLRGAKDFAIHEHRQAGGEWHNQCQKFSRQCVGAAPFGLTARLAFNSIPQEHRHASSPPPPGSIAYYGRPDSGAGHAVFVVEGGRVWSNDIKRQGQIDRVDWDIFPARWGLAYRGWIDKCPSGELPVGHGSVGVGARRLSDHHEYRQSKKVYRSKMHLGQDDSDSVWNLQLALLTAGLQFVHGPSGNYGRHTVRMCSRFQRRQGWTGMDADGIAGPETVRRLGLDWVNG